MPDSVSCDQLKAQYLAAPVGSQEEYDILMQWRFQCSDDPAAFPASKTGQNDPPPNG